MSQKIKIWIPAYYSSINYAPARVLPHIYFYNGLIDCESWWMEDQYGSGRQQNQFPYFDNYNVVTGSFPTEDSQTLLFNNETAVYGVAPSGSLYSNYWSTYVSLLYNPYTRLINCSAIIPLANYTQLNLNDIVEWRGNMYHLRAINNYSVKTGECQLQLLGPIIADTFGIASNNTPATTTTTTTSTTSTTTTSTTTTSTTTTTTTTINPANCIDRHYQNNTSTTIYWSSKNCGGNSIGGYVTPGNSFYTGCMDITAFGASGALTLLGQNYC